MIPLKVVEQENDDQSDNESDEDIEKSKISTVNSETTELNDILTPRLVDLDGKAVAKIRACGTQTIVMF